MDFVTNISTGATIKFTVTEFARAFLESVTADPHNWFGKVSHQFVGQCFAAVDLKFNVSIVDFSGNCNYPYREDNLRYIFNPKPFVLKGVESFLEQLPAKLASYGRALAQVKHTTNLDKHFYKITQPLPSYLRLVRIWCEVVNSICGNVESDSWPIDKYLREPLARVSFWMLCGLAELLSEYGSQFAELQELCLTLVIHVRYGIFYTQTSKLVLQPMLDMFGTHFKLFFGESQSALHFVYCVWSCDMPERTSHVLAYEFLKHQLEIFAHGQQSDASGNLYLRQLTNQLITSKYLAIPLEALKACDPKPLLVAALNYLLCLQSHVVSTEIFPRSLLDHVLDVVLRVPQPSVCSLAAQLYIKLARRQYDEQEIVAHLLETFLKQQHARRTTIHRNYGQFLAMLSRYLKALMPQLPALGKFKFYWHLLNAEEVRPELSLMAAQAICALFRLYAEQYQSDQLAKQQLHQLLNKWPDLLERTSHLEARAVLYSVYDAVDFAAIASESERNMEMLMELESECLRNFLEDETLDELVLRTLYSNLTRSVAITRNEQIHETAAKTLHEKYNSLQRQLSEQTEDSPEEQLQQAYAQCVRRLKALVKSGQLPIQLARDIYETLAANLLPPTKSSADLELHGCECLAYMLAMLHKEKPQDETMLGLAAQLSNFCCRQLEKLTAPVDSDLHRLQALFCSICVLQLGMHLPPLEKRSYAQLAQLLTVATLSGGARADTLASSYLGEMYHHFRCLHACHKIELPDGKKIWKLLLHYKLLPAGAGDMSLELSQLIGTIVEQRTELYARCLPVIHLHIYNEQAISKQRLTAALEAHIELIDYHAGAQDAWLLRVHSFCAALELMLKSLSVRRPQDNRNRLLPLQNLLPLVAPLRLEASHFDVIAQLLSLLKEDSGKTNHEAQDLETFISHISAHKYRCEDEHAQAEAKKIGWGQLKPQPPGPMAKWQLEALNYENAT